MAPAYAYGQHLLAAFQHRGEAIFGAALIGDRIGARCVATRWRENGGGQYYGVILQKRLQKLINIARVIITLLWRDRRART